MGLTWSPDSRSIAVAGTAARNVEPGQISARRHDGKGLLRLTSEGENDVVGWTRLARSSAGFSDSADRTRHRTRHGRTSTPVMSLAADETRVAFVPEKATTDCFPSRSGRPATTSPSALAPFSRAGAGCRRFPRSRSRLSCGLGRLLRGQDEGHFALATATIADPIAQGVSASEEGTPTFNACSSTDLDHLRGDGDLLVFNDQLRSPPTLVRIGVGCETCPESGSVTCRTLRKDWQGWPVDSVSDGLIATREPGAVTVSTRRASPFAHSVFARADVRRALLDGGQLAVGGPARWSYTTWPAGAAASGHGERLPGRRRRQRHRLVAQRQQDHAAAARRRPLVHARAGAAPVLADLEEPGLYISYATAGGGGRTSSSCRAWRSCGGSERR